MVKDWIITRISTNKLADSKEQFPLVVQGVNLNHESPKHGECERYFHWRVANVYDERYDIGHAVIDDDVPLVLLQEYQREKLRQAKLRDITRLTEELGGYDGEWIKAEETK